MKKTRVHFMGVRGSGISYTASIALERGFEVSGCDLAKSGEYTSFLKENRVVIEEDHNPSHLKGIDLLVVSPAIYSLGKDNGELKQASEKNIPVITWQKFLGDYLVKDKYLIAIAGTHGKGTTTSILGLMLEEAGLDPTVCLGANVVKWKKNFRVGEGKYFVLEADEYNDNFLNFKPNGIGLTNIEMDHPEYFSDEEALLSSVLKFVRSIKKGKESVVLLNKDDYGARNLKKMLFQEKKIWFLIKQKINYLKTHFYEFSLSDKNADFYLEDLKTTNKGLSFALISNLFPEINSGNLGKYIIPIFGKHNASNTLCALSLLYSVEYPSRELIAASKRALEKFSGASRRFEIKGTFDGITVIDDYAHHPTEIRAVLTTARERFPLKKIWVVFQPHTFTRTKYLFNDFVKVFKEGLSDEAIITDIFPSREKDFGLINSRQLVEGIGLAGVKYIPNLMEVVKYLKRQVKSGEVIVVMGAGDVNKISDMLKVENG